MGGGDNCPPLHPISLGTYTLTVWALAKMAHVYSFSLICAFFTYWAFYFQIIQDALTVLGFEESQKKAMYKLTAGIMIFGNVQWKQNPRDEQADIETPDSKS